MLGVQEIVIVMAALFVLAAFVAGAVVAVLVVTGKRTKRLEEAMRRARLSASSGEEAGPPDRARGDGEPRGGV